MRHHHTLIAVGCQLAALSLATAIRAQSAVQDSAVVVDSNVAIPMRDGVILRADILRPGLDGRHPVLVYRTPYNKRSADAALSTARKAAARGYVVVLQDVRGRYASDGEYVAYQQEGRDGYDTIEWAAAQPWSNGSVGTYGLSYPGAVQWLAAIESPPHLKAMVPAMTFASPMQFWYSNGVWDGSWTAWIYRNIAPDRRRRLGLGRAVPWDSVKDRIRGTLPLFAMKDLEVVSPWYYDWLRHPAYDPWWDWADLRGKYGRTSAAVLNFSAWYDEAYGPHGATSNFAGVVASRAGKPHDAFLVMGPWSHGVPDPTDTVVGERHLGAAAVIDYDGMVLRFMDRFVRGIDNAATRRRTVQIFVLGSNKWIEGDAWPLPGVRADTILLKRPGSSTTIVSDPSKPVVDIYDRYGAHDYRALVERSDVATFDTAPLESDVTVVGAMKAELSISVDAPDTDIWAKVYDVAPDGAAFNLMSPGLDVVRASYRNASPRRELLQPGKVYSISLGDLLTANTFRKGHRIRVAIMTSFVPGFSRNLHTGELETTSSASRVARVTIHHSAARPSRLILPVLPAAAMLESAK